MSLENLLWLKEKVDNEVADLRNFISILFQMIIEIEERLDKLEKTKGDYETHNQA